MTQAPWAASTWWLFTILVDPKMYAEDSRSLLKKLAKQKIITKPLWQPMHRSPDHQGVQAYHCGYPSDSSVGR